MEFKTYHISNFEECIELFDLNSPAYFAEEERKDFREYLQSNEDQYLLGFIKNKLICCFGITEHSKELCSLSWIMVHPNNHKSGYGSKMMSYFMNYVKDNKKETVLIATSQHANRFFETYGAKEIQFIKNGWGNGMHRIDMQIDLKS